MVVADALDPADQLAAHALEPGLLGQLAHDRLGQVSPASTRPPGTDHSPAAGPAAAPDQQQPAVVDGDRADAHLGPSRRVIGRSEPVVHDERAGGEARRLEEVLRRAVARAARGRRCRRSPAPCTTRRPSSISASPTPTARASGST